MHRIISFLLLILTLLFVSGWSIGYAQNLSKADMTNQELLLAKKVDSLFREFDKAINSTPHQAMEYAKKALDISETGGYEAGIANGNLMLGRAYFGLSNLDQAYNYLTRSLLLFQDQNYRQGIVLSHKWLGTVNRHKNNSEVALKHYLRASELAEDIKFDSEIPKITQNIAAIFLDQKQYDKAIEYFQKSLPEIQGEYGQSVCLANLGLAYLRKGKKDKAMECFQQSIDLCRSKNDEVCELLPLGHIVTLYTNLGNYDKALEYSLAMLERQEQAGSILELLELKNSIGLIYLDMGKFQSAVDFFDQSRDLAEQIRYRNLAYIHANISLAYEGQKKYDLALKHHWTFQDLKDSLFNAEKDRKIDELLTKFDTEKKEQEIVILQKEKELQGAELAKQAYERNVAVLGSILALVIAAIFGFVYQQKIRASQQLVIISNLINEQKTMELVRENEIRAINANIDGQEKERTRIARDLHDGIAGNLASIKLNLSKKRTPPLQTIIKDLDETYHEVRIISHHLMPPKVKETPFIDLISHYLYDIGEMCNLELKLDYYPKEGIDKLPNEVKVEVYRIIQELMSNIVKHSQTKNVSISLTQIESNLNLIVEDSGVGFNQSKKTDGIGIKNIFDRVNKLKGQIHIDTAPNQGTTVNIDIPTQTEATIFA